MTENKKQGNSLYTEMLDIHKHIFDQLKYAEAKCGIITTISLGFFAVLARMVYVFFQNKGFKFYSCLNFIDLISFILFALCAFLCILCLWDLLKAFNPQLDNGESNSKQIQGNIYFFENIAVIKSDDFLECVKEKFGVTELESREALLDLSNQTCVLSQITSAKHKNCRKALNKIKWSFPIFVLFLIFAGLSTQAQGAVIM